MLAHAAYLALAAGLASAVPLAALGEAQGGLVVLGAIGAWRYGWAAVNFLRAAVYLRLVYPRRRACAERALAEVPVKAHAFFLVTSYRIEPEISMQVYAAAMRAAARSEGGATLIASVVDGADLRLIRRLHAALGPAAERVRLEIDQIAPVGKRDALGHGLRRIARNAPTSRDLVLLVDGDSCVPADVVARAAAAFTDRTVGALTTDEAVRIARPGLFRDWFELRFAQRQVMMSSVALSGRVLTLTGRMSAFRADLASDPSFIRQVVDDHVDHWRFGRVQFLTGDDKSTWFWLLRRGWRMAYLPDLQSESMETQPRPGFVASAVALMVRWYGNMLRTNGRALALPARRIGYFTWWSLLDQRVSIWTTLAGPVAVLLTALLATPAILPAYAAWVLLTRYTYCCIIAAFRGRGFPVTWPLLLYFGQIVGAAVKSFVLFRLDRQKWTRQGSGRTAAGTAGRLRAAGSLYLHALAVGWLIAGVLFLSDLV